MGSIFSLILRLFSRISRYFKWFFLKFSYTRCFEWLSSQASRVIAVSHDSNFFKTLFDLTQSDQVCRAHISWLNVNLLFSAKFFFSNLTEWVLSIVAAWSGRGFSIHISESRFHEKPLVLSEWVLHTFRTSKKPLLEKWNFLGKVSYGTPFLKRLVLYWGQLFRNKRRA